MQSDLSSDCACSGVVKDLSDFCLSTGSRHTLGKNSGQVNNNQHFFDSLTFLLTVLSSNQGPYGKTSSTVSTQWHLFRGVSQDPSHVIVVPSFSRSVWCSTLT